MSDITAKMVDDLRRRTGAGLMDCKKALAENEGNAEKAIEFLRKKGIASAAKKAGRETAEGIIEAYIHMGRIGVLLELNCETDFVAKNDAFKALAKDICMHIAAAAPIYISREEVPVEVIEKEKEIARASFQEKPDQIAEKLVENKVEKYFKDTCLLEQAFAKNSSISIKDLVVENISKIGENIIIRRFSRYCLGE